MGLLEKLGKKLSGIIDPGSVATQTVSPVAPPAIAPQVIRPAAPQAPQAPLPIADPQAPCPSCGFLDSGQFCSQCGSPLNSTVPLTKPRKKPMKNDDPLNSFHSRIVGVTYPNDDGSSRQELLKNCKVGEKLRLVHCPVPQDENAVKIFRVTGEQLGWLNRDLAAELAPRLMAGSKVDCEIAVLDGGTREKKTRGCAILITKYSMR